MMRLSAIALSAMMFASPSDAQDNKPLTVGDALNVLAALRNLDGHTIVVKDAPLVQPWEFGSGALRLKIANDIIILGAVEKASEEARVVIVKEILRSLPADKDGNPAMSIPPGSAAFMAFQAQFQDAMNAPAAGTQDLARIKASELKLDKNEIPASTLVALKPILDIDVK
jgi:hypothetical protein